MQYHVMYSLLCMYSIYNVCINATVNQIKVIVITYGNKYITKQNKKTISIHSS